VAASPQFVIVGAGLAGAKAAETLREEGFDGSVTLIGEEMQLPYERPPLSKDYLRGESTFEKVLVRPEDFWATNGIDVLTMGRAVSIDRKAHRIELEDRSSLKYDRLLLATGSIPRRPPIPGIDLDGVCTFRTIGDADRLRRAMREEGGPLVLVGAGWIGCEIAASARQLGVEEVIVVDHASAPLEHVLGADVGRWFAQLHREHGVDLRLGAGVDRFEGSRRLERVRLADGTTIDAATVVLGVGIMPDTRLAEVAGLDVDDGIAVDPLLTTSDPDIFAAGDVASAEHPRYGRRVRVEHWSTALNQGAAAARSMLGRGAPYDRLPYFFSDQYDAGMEYAGLHSPDDRQVIRGSLEAAAFQVFWLDAGNRVTAGMHVNDWDAIDPIRRLIESGRAVRPEALSDLAIPVEEPEVTAT
jgi:3-phenylpropionate/trans-cinnamate dioxygenase ferredoxin reductase subunit